jgi:hypothetical protein
LVAAFAFALFGLSHVRPFAIARIGRAEGRIRETGKLSAAAFSRPDMRASMNLLARKFACRHLRRTTLTQLTIYYTLELIPLALSFCQNLWAAKPARKRAG